jgi:hypothetical protein
MGYDLSKEAETSPYLEACCGKSYKTARTYDKVKLLV